MIVNKFTIGFVVQSFDSKTGKCIAQEFIAGDEVEWETKDSHPINPLEHAEYQPFEMVQP